MYYSMKHILTHEEVRLSNQLNNAINEGLLDSLSKLGNIIGNVVGVFRNLWKNVKKASGSSNNDIFDALQKYDETMSGFTILKKVDFTGVKTFLTTLVQYAEDKYEYAIEKYTTLKDIEDGISENNSISLSVVDDSVKTILSAYKNQMGDVLNGSDTGKAYKKAMLNKAEIIVSKAVIDKIKKDNNKEDDDTDLSDFENSIKEAESENDAANKAAESKSKEVAKDLEKTKAEIESKFGFKSNDSATMADECNKVIKESVINEKRSEKDEKAFDEVAKKDSDNYFALETIKDQYPDLSTEDFKIALNITKAIIISNFNKYKKAYSEEDVLIQQYIANVTLRIVIQALTTGKVDDELLVAATGLMTTNFGVGLNAPVITYRNTDSTTFTQIVDQLDNEKILKTTINNDETIKKFKSNYNVIKKTLINKTRELNKNNQPDL